jgi:hypothetical protein
MTRPISLLLVLAAVACSSSGEPGGSDRGTIRVTTTTAGTEVDPDGYNLMLDGQLDLAIGSNATVSRTGVEPGSHTVDIANVAGNCSVAAPRLKTITVAADATSPTDFSITCFSTIGTLGLRVSSTGYVWDIDSLLTYQVDVQTAYFIAPGLDTSITQAVGQHVVTIGHVAANCTEPNGLSRTFAITPAGTTQVQFDFSCTPVTGSVWITVLMTGANPDADGYVISLDSTRFGHLGSPNSSVEWFRAAAGPHAVYLSDIAGNCILGGGAARQYTVVAGQQVADTMRLDCP